MVKNSENGLNEENGGVSNRQLKQKQKQALKKKEKKQRNKQNKKQQYEEQVNEELIKKELISKINEISTQNKQNEIIEENNIQEEVEESKNNGHIEDNINSEQNQTEQANGHQENGDQIEQEENPDKEILDSLTFLTGQYYDEFKDVFLNFEHNADRMLSKAQEVDESQLQAQKEKEEQIERERQEAAEERREQKEKMKLEKENNVSRKQRKANRWLKVAQLKALVKRPDLVEAWDITGPDPMLLVQLKSLRNTVGVPEHWCQKRKFLQNKRGILKPPFRLPEHIENTGIAKLRDPFTERDGVAMVKQKLKDRMNPKLGKIDIDYEILHDAFFKYATKPKLTIHGDLYKEGKEDSVQQNKYKPGRVSEELRNALGISEFQPPPWLINMQRYGPPPAYPQLRILGNDNNLGQGFLTKQQHLEEATKAINQPGVYASFKIEEQDEEDARVDKSYWGGLIEEEEYEGEEEMEEREEVEESDDLQPTFATELTKHQQEMEKQQLQSGTTSMIDGLETPEVDLRKGKERDDQFQYSQQPSDLPLFQVLEPTNAGAGQQGGIFTGGQGYIIPDSTQKQ